MSAITLNHSSRTRLLFTETFYCNIVSLVIYRNYSANLRYIYYLVTMLFVELMRWRVNELIAILKFVSIVKIVYAKKKYRQNISATVLLLFVCYRQNRSTNVQCAWEINLCTMVYQVLWCNCAVKSCSVHTSNSCVEYLIAYRRCFSWAQVSTHTCSLTFWLVGLL